MTKEGLFFVHRNSCQVLCTRPSRKEIADQVLQPYLFPLVQFEFTTAAITVLNLPLHLIYIHTHTQANIFTHTLAAYAQTLKQALQFKRWWDNRSAGSEQFRNSQFSREKKQ